MSLLYLLANLGGQFPQTDKKYLFFMPPLTILGANFAFEQHKQDFQENIPKSMATRFVFLLRLRIYTYQSVEVRSMITVVSTKPIISYCQHLQTWFEEIRVGVEASAQMASTKGVSIDQDNELHGSASWYLALGGERKEVLIKLVPYDSRTPEIQADLACSEGLTLWFRNDFLDASSMQTLYEWLGCAYRHCPPHSLVVLQHHKDKPFQVANCTKGILIPDDQRVLADVMRRMSEMCLTSAAHWS